jgi:chromatin modification-related protein VID21
VPRRRPTTTVRVERRRNQKHLALIDAMRKQAKKRESNAHKAMQAANMRKNNESHAPARQPSTNKTPRDYSLMRWERDQQLAELVHAHHFDRC